MQAFAVSQIPRQPLQRLGATLHEGRAQQQVFGRVAREGKFRGDYDAGASCVRLQRRLLELAGTCKVADGRVDLSERHLQDACPKPE